jgi:hypothetical protein
MRARRILSALVLGVAVGLLLDGLLLINSSGWLLNPVLMAPIPLLGLTIGFVLGWKNKAHALPWYAVPLLAVILWPSLFWGPVKLREWQFRRFAAQLPAYRTADRQIQSMSVLGGDDAPNIRVMFETKDGSIPEMIKFYGEHLVKNNWVPEQPRQEYKQDVWYNFRKDRGNVSIIGYARDTGVHNVAIIRRYSTRFYR